MFMDRKAQLHKYINSPLNQLLFNEIPIKIPTRISWNLTGWSQTYMEVQKPNSQGSPEDEEQVGRGNDLPYQV